MNLKIQTYRLPKLHRFKINIKAPGRFELPISCLLDRRFNQLSHGAADDDLV